MGLCALLGLGLTLLNASPQIDLSALTSAQRDVFQQVASEEFCGCTSPLTLAGCLERKPQCRIAVDLGQMVARAARAGALSPAILGYLSQGVLGPMCSAPQIDKLQGAPQKGKDNAPVTITEFADFRCSHCREAVPMVHKALRAYSSKVRLVYVPLVLQDNPLGFAAAEAALAAHAQGKFWEMHAALFAREDGNFEPGVLADLAKKIGLNTKQFAKDMETHRFRDQVLAYKKTANAAGIDGTPAFFINGRRFAPLPGVCSLEERFELELDHDGTGCQ